MRPLSVIGLAAGPSHGAGYWCLAILWNTGWLLVLLKSRLRARPSHPGTCSGPDEIRSSLIRRDRFLDTNNADA